MLEVYGFAAGHGPYLVFLVGSPLGHGCSYSCGLGSRGVKERCNVSGRREKL